MHFSRNAFLAEDLLLPLLSSQFHVDRELFSCYLPLFLGCTHFPKVGRHSTRSSDLPFAGISHILLSILITSLLPSLNHRPRNSSFILTFPSNFPFLNVLLSHIPHFPHYPSNSVVHLIVSQTV